MRKRMTRRSAVIAALLLGGLWLAPTAAVRAASTCAPEGVIRSSNDKFHYQNNFYHSPSGSTQCLYVTDPDAGGFNITNDASVPTNGAPSGYPSVYVGCHWGSCTDNALSNLPAQASDLASADTTWSVSPQAHGAWDISYDIWFDQSPSTRGQPNGTEIMIWLDNHGGITPAGSKTAHVTINGIHFDVYTAPKGCCGFNPVWNIVSFRASSPLRSVSFSLLPFFNYAMAQNMLRKSWWLIDVEAGFEPWQGGSGLASHAFAFSLSKYSQETK